jgi:hypothetical protein
MEDEIPHLLVFRTVMTIYFLSNVKRNFFEQLERKEYILEIDSLCFYASFSPPKDYQKGVNNDE